MESRLEKVIIIQLPFLPEEPHCITLFLKSSLTAVVDDFVIDDYDYDHNL